MTYRTHDTIPTYTTDMAAIGTLVWANKDIAPPARGTRITVTMNGLGEATVMGYFSESGFLGLLVKFVNPPDWYVRQNKGANVVGHIFGPEFKVSVDALLKRIAKLEDALNEIYDTFEDEMDADCDDGQMIPNRAMRICTLIEEAGR